ncbi:MAG: hypothetical protein IKF78_15875 [Atopobiaceae bacterium]|nr:hypothetical protein [Atopobiaceae bacterium]
MEFKDLAPEQQNRIKACETQEEFMELADELDLDLTPEVFKEVSGGLPNFRKLQAALDPGFAVC